MKGFVILGWQLSERGDWTMAGTPPKDADVVEDPTTVNALTKEFVVKLNK